MSNNIDNGMIVAWGIVLLIVVWILLAIIAAIRDGILRLFRPRKIESSPSTTSSPNGRETSSPVGVALRDWANTSATKSRSDTDSNGGQSFEVDQLHRYYSAILSQCKISFWFSLIFAAVGFLVIVYAALISIKSNTFNTSVLQVVAGVVIDAVAALFFVWSKNLQKKMGEFFEKLRGDRAQHEARGIVESIKSEAMKDALRVNLVLHYSGLITDVNLLQDIVRESLARNGGERGSPDAAQRNPG